jgi:hypothetical protein
MLSKCANPECETVFRYLHEGKIFRLAPSPEVQLAAAAKGAHLTERFWLCDSCSKRLTVTWNGISAQVVRLDVKPELSNIPTDTQEPEEDEPIAPGRLAKRLAASAGRRNR